MKKTLTVLRYFANCLSSSLFLLFASVQFNDPDPMIWILAYTSTAVLGFLYLNRSLAAKLKWTYLGLAMILLAGSYIQFPPQWEGFGTEMKTTNNELARESIGLLLCGMVLLLQFVSIKGKTTQ